MVNDEDRISVGKAENLTGQQFGELIVLYRIKNNGKTNGAKWRCQCSCGNITDVLASNLKRNHTLSCGCLQKEKTSQNHFINEKDKKYGKLTVLERGDDYISPSGEHKITWKCQCECGNIVTVNGDSLRRGKTLSCGCYRIKQVSNRCDKKYLGKTFHYITVLNKLKEKNKTSKESLWECQCNLCNNIFTLPTGKIKTQISCGCLQDSYGVSIIKALLKNNNINFETEKIFDNCIFESTNRKARFDFYVENRYIIEFDGQQHFSYSGGWNTEKQLIETQKRDEYKNQWCKNHNIPLIRIPYWKINDLVLDDLLIETSNFLLISKEEDNG